MKNNNFESSFRKVEKIVENTNFQAFQNQKSQDDLGNKTFETSKKTVQKMTTTSLIFKKFYKKYRFKKESNIANSAIDYTTKVGKTLLASSKAFGNHFLKIFLSSSAFIFSLLFIIVVFIALILTTFSLILSNQIMDVESKLKELDENLLTEFYNMKADKHELLADVKTDTNGALQYLSDIDFTPENMDIILQEYHNSLYVIYTKSSDEILIAILDYSETLKEY